MMETYETPFDFSVYQLELSGDKLVVGGSEWNRLKIPYSEAVTQKARGIVLVGNKIVEFEHEVYSLVKLGENTVFVGLSRGQSATNMLSLDDFSVKKGKVQGNDGVINACFDEEKDEIIIGERSGSVAVLDKDLNKLGRIALDPNKEKIWSVCHDKGRIYCGGYNGNVYIVDRRPFRMSKKIDLKKYAAGTAIKEKISKGFFPNVFGLDTDDKNLFIGTRWGQLCRMDKKNYTVEGLAVIPFEITFIKASDDFLFLGTRDGSLLMVNKNLEGLKRLHQIKPKLQGENGVWKIALSNSKLYAAYADGFVSVTTDLSLKM